VAKVGKNVRIGIAKGEHESIEPGTFSKLIKRARGSHAADPIGRNRKSA